MIVGTAGHIDHGKTALVQALTGVDADRLKEEQRRGISIDIGFAYQARADGGVTGFVDMPGHEKFMRNMLAGAAGIDCLLLVVAADDGVMTQTREHLAVANLLGVDRGLVVISKADLVDKARLDIVRDEIAQLLGDTPLSNAQVLSVSVKEPRGIAALQTALDGFLADEKQPSQGPVRFVVDRSFSLPGAGTVVSGMLVQGELRVGDQLCASPSGLPIRIRGLHAQNRPSEVAVAGQRCGIALGGRVSKGDISRGDWLLSDRLHAPTDRIDVRLGLLASEAKPFRHWTAVRFHHGSAEIAGRVAILQEGPLLPGENCMAQIVLEKPVAAAVMDRFVIRAANGDRSLGGGSLVDLRPPSRRRKQERRLGQLDAMAIADPVMSLEAQTRAWPFYVDLRMFERDRALAEDVVAQFDADSRLWAIPSAATRVALHGDIRARLRVSAIAAVKAYHQKYPRLLGAGLKHLQRLMDPPLPLDIVKAVLDALVSYRDLARDGGSFRMPSHRLGLDRGDDLMWEKVRPLLGGDARFRPPLLAELSKELGLRAFDLRRVMRIKTGENAVVEVGQGRFFLSQTLAEIGVIIGEIASQAAEENEGGMFCAADLRDRLNNGRKVAIELLEYFDRQAITARRGDERVLDTGRLQEFLAGSR